MTKSILAGLAFAAAIASGGLPAQARGGHDPGAVQIVEPWAPAPPPGAPTLAGYLTITNRGSSADHLLGGTSPRFKDIEVHEMSMTGQVMRMRPIAGGLAIGPGQSMTLAPGGDRHLMLIGPKQAFKPGDRIPATLRFEKAGQVKVVFLVREPGARAAAPMAPMRMR